VPQRDDRARARTLFESGRFEEARDAYLRIVTADPSDADALTDLGTVLLRTGYREAARTTYERAAALAPGRATAHANLANVLFALGRYDEARARYEAALACDPGSNAAHQGLSYTLVRLGRDAEVREHRRRGFTGRAVTRAPFRGTSTPVDVLLLVSAAGGTFYTDEILDDRIFRVTTLVADAYAGEPLPPADVVVNAIADADRCGDELAAMATLLAERSGAIVNLPERVLATTRVGNARRLAQLAGVVTARTEHVPRVALLDDDAEKRLTAQGFVFPLLLRAPGYHTGEHFVRVDEPAALRVAAAALPGNELLVLAFHDLRGAHGAVRKYRVMVVDGVLYPLHLAVSSSWKVHYFSADMARDAAYRAEEARFLADPTAVLGAPAWAALEAVGRRLGLDYAGIDFALDDAGAVVVFEANATMIVLPPGPEAIWDYRRPHVARVIAAAQTMVRRFTP
jgi:hypothetical protein